MNKELTRLIEEWAVNKNLHNQAPEKQMLKLQEEIGELSEGIAKDKRDMIVDSIGDTYVVLTILSMQLGLNIESCIAEAYEEIKDRTGEMKDGVFVKQADL